MKSYMHHGNVRKDTMDAEEPSSADMHTQQEAAKAATAVNSAHSAIRVSSNKSTPPIEDVVLRIPSMSGDSATAAQRENATVVSWALSNFPDTFLALPSCKTMTFVEVKLKDFYNDINLSGSRKLLLIGKRDEGLGQSENLYAYCMSCYSSGPARYIHFATESMGKYTETRSSIIDLFENHLCDPFHASYDGHSPWKRYEIRSIVALARYYFILTGHISWDGGKSLSSGDFELACNRVARNSGGHPEELSTPCPPRRIPYSNSSPNTTRRMIAGKQATQKGKQGSKKRKLDETCQSQDTRQQRFQGLQSNDEPNRPEVTPLDEALVPEADPDNENDRGIIEPTEVREESPLDEIEAGIQSFSKWITDLQSARLVEQKRLVSENTDLRSNLAKLNASLEQEKEKRLQLEQKAFQLTSTMSTLKEDTKEAQAEAKSAKERAEQMGRELLAANSRTKKAQEEFKEAESKLKTIRAVFGDNTDR